MVLWLVLLNLVGGESVSDVERLEGDEGLKRVMEEAEVYGLGRRERQELGKRWRGKRRRVGPSVSALFRYLGGFHDEEEAGKREEHKAFVPRGNGWLGGLWKVNGGMLRFANRHRRQRVATLDMDASVVETQKREARYSYRKRKAYQPLTTYWYEADLVLHSEFRDGNVPAGHEQLRVMREALGSLPEGVEQVRLRSDTAGYQRELLRYCAEGRDERFGVIEFAVGVDVTVEFKRAVVRVAEDQWQPVVEGRGQEWAEVNFVPNWVAQGKKEVVYRFLAIRERFEQARLPGMGEQWELPFPAMEMGSRGWYKVFGLVTNRELPGEEVIEWSRQRCGKGEEVHSVLKRDLAGGRLPSGKFGGNAAWWAMVVLAFNLNSIMKWLGWDVASQAAEGHPIRPRNTGGSGGAARSPVDHLPGPRPSLVPGAAAGTGEDTGTGRLTLSCITLMEHTPWGGRRLRRVARAKACPAPRPPA